MVIIATGALSVGLFMSIPHPVPASTTTDEYLRARITAIASHMDPESGVKLLDSMTVNVIGGARAGEEIVIPFSGNAEIVKANVAQTGDTAVIVVNKDEGRAYFVEVYRLGGLAWVFAGFIALAVVFAGVRGITSILGLFFSLLVLVRIVLAGVVAGYNPFLVSIAGGILISIATLYIGHGVNRRTSVSLLSTIITILVSAGFAWGAVYIGHMFGLGSEEALLLDSGPLAGIDTRGLFLGGIILGALGVLDDITTAQASVVAELKEANPSFTRADLYMRALRVGKEHITSLINTLALAYFGASFPLFLLYSMNQIQPLWVVLNSEFIAEEVIRTVAGSVSLILAVPVTTAIAVYIETRSPHHH